MSVAKLCFANVPSYQVGNSDYRKLKVKVSLETFVKAGLVQ